MHGGRKVVGALPEGSPNDRVAAEQSCDDIAERAEHAHGVHHAADRNIRPINELPRQHLGRSHKLAATVRDMPLRPERPRVRGVVTSTHRMIPRL